MPHDDPHDDSHDADPAEDLHPAIRAAGWPQPASRVPGVTVRDARAEDHDAIARLTVSSYLDGGHLHPADSYLQELRDVAARARRARVLVGEVETEAGTVVAGSVVLTLPGMPMSETARDGELEFRMLAVGPEAQRRGVARALVRAAIDRAGQLEGIDAVVLTTMETMTAAHRLYESEGFVRIPERDWRLSDLGLEPTDGKDQLYWVFRRPV